MTPPVDVTSHLGSRGPCPKRCMSQNAHPTTASLPSIRLRREPNDCAGPRGAFYFDIYVHLTRRPSFFALSGVRTSRRSCSGPSPPAPVSPPTPLTPPSANYPGRFPRPRRTIQAAKASRRVISRGRRHCLSRRRTMSSVGTGRSPRSEWGHYQICSNASRYTWGFDVSKRRLRFVATQVFDESFGGHGNLAVTESVAVFSFR